MSKKAGQLHEVVINTFDFYPFNHWDNDYDGHDIIETSPPYVSISDTRDPCGLAQSWVKWKDNVVGGTLDFNDSWILFPTKLPAYGTTDGVATRGSQLSWEMNREARNQPNHCCRESVPTPTEGENAGVCRRRVQGPCDPENPGATSCARPDNVAYARWTRTTMTFTHGQTLDTIIVTNYYPPGVTSTGKERFYFTKLYGMTRAEAWKVVPDNPGTPQCNGSEVEFEPASGAWFVRTDCRDATEIIPNAAGFDPHSWPAPVPKIPTLQWEAENQLSHGTGAAYADGWGVGTGPDNAGCWRSSENAEFWT